MKLSFEQEVKLQLVLLAEYLQCKELSDVQIKMYAAELVCLGPLGLSRSIALLKEDPEVWAGRMPLPAKLKAYLRGDVNVLASEAARLILSMNTVQQAHEHLPPFELSIAKDYGINAIVNRTSEQSSIIFAQVRDAAKARLRVQREGSVAIGHDRRASTIDLLEASEAQEGINEDGAGP